jgi:hypothetical protein
VVTACAIGYLVQCVRSVPYRYETEVSEGNEQLASMRIAAGLSPYGWPRSTFYPARFYIYPPVFESLAALVRHAAGVPPSEPAPWTGRLISALAGVGSAAIIGLIVYRRTRQPLPALIASLLLLAVEPHHLFLNVSRADSLGLFIGLLTICCATSTSPWARLAFAPLAAIAVLTKLPFMAFGIVGIFILAGRNRREAVLQALLSAALLAAAILAVNRVTNGDFWRDSYRYLFTVHSDTIWPDRGPLSSLGEYGLRLATYSIVPEIFAIRYVVMRWRAGEAAQDPWVVAYIGITAATLFSLLGYGAYTNRLLPAIAMCNLLFGFALADLADRKGAATRIPCSRAAVSLCIAALFCLWHNPYVERIGDSPAVVADQTFLEKRCRASDRPILAEWPMLAVMNGQPDAVEGLVLMKPLFGPEALAQMDLLRADVRSHRFGMIVVTQGFGKHCGFMPLSIYRLVERTYTRRTLLKSARLELFEP